MLWLAVVEYFVIAADGQEYGPANVETLRHWAAEGRLFPATMLRSAESGQVVPASSVANLFPQNVPPAYTSPPAAYPRQGYPQVGAPIPQGNAGSSDVWGAIIRSGLALVFFFVFRGIGLIVGGYALYYAIRGYRQGHPHGVLAIAISGIAFAVICVGWLLRMSTVGQPYR